MRRRRAVLPDRVSPPVDLLLVGINPGMRSAAVGHHFAGPSNRFWRLLYDAGLVSERLRPEDDARLPEWGIGITNLVPRATAGIDTLMKAEYIAGLPVLRRKVRRWHPRIIAFVGVTLYRSVAGLRASDAVALGRQGVTFEGADVYVVPNPSGRNAHFPYGTMQSTWRELAAAVRGGGGAEDVRSRWEGESARPGVIERPPRRQVTE
ncbi:MAG: mismatch-specific DNA-glycosylase [Vicinamibacterales bacterium]